VGAEGSVGGRQLTAQSRQERRLLSLAGKPTRLDGEQFSIDGWFAEQLRSQTKSLVGSDGTLFVVPALGHERSLLAAPS
jgi:hypothetical protein